MTDFVNGSFEDATGDQDWLPDGWTFTADVNPGGALYAPFDGPYGFTEAYEYGWLNNHQDLAALVDDDLGFAVFGVSPDLFTWEDYERSWSNNEDDVDSWPASVDYAEWHSTSEDAEDYEQEWPAQHQVADSRYMDPGFYIGDNTNTRAQLNTLKATYNAHLADTIVHTVADVANVVAVANATDEPTAVALANEIWVKAWVHFIDESSYHLPVPYLPSLPNTFVGYPATNYAGAAVISGFMVMMFDFHATWANNDGPAAIDEFYEIVGTPPAPPEPDLFGALLQVLFPTTGYVDTYEWGWSSNQNDLDDFDPGDLSLAQFPLAAGGTVTAETYEEIFTITAPSTPGTASVEYTIDPTGKVQVDCTNCPGTYLLQTKSERSPTWVTRETFTTTGTAVLDDGYQAIRIYCQAYTAGSPAFTYRWAEPG
jgi:hypothetical protein